MKLSRSYCTAGLKSTQYAQKEKKSFPWITQAISWQSRPRNSSPALSRASALLGGLLPVPSNSLQNGITLTLITSFLCLKTFGLTVEAGTNKNSSALHLPREVCYPRVGEGLEKQGSSKVSAAVPEPTARLSFNPDYLADRATWAVVCNNH